MPFSSFVKNNLINSHKHNPQNNKSNYRVIVYILLIWLISFMVDRTWFSLDDTIPSWDPSEYLNGATVYQEALRDINIFDSSWWRDYWLLSNKVPPLMYIISAPFFLIFGISVDNGNLILSFFNLILILSLYYLGKLLFNQKIALFNCLLIQFIPTIYYYRREFLLDFPLTVIVIFSYTCLTYWYFIPNKYSWWKSILFGISFGAGLLLKQTFLFFLFFPYLLISVYCLFRRQWLRFAQLVTAFIASIFVFFPWYRTNWLLIFTSGKRATIDSAIIEGDPPLNTLQAWTFYTEIMPYVLSWFIVSVALIAIIYLSIKYLSQYSLNLKYIPLFLKKNFYQNNYGEKKIVKVTIWLLIFIVGGYLLSSLNMNKDDRYIAPLIPIITLIISAFISSYKGKFNLLAKVLIILVSFSVMTLNLFPLGGEFITGKLSPKMQNFPYMGEKWATPEVINVAVEMNPYLRTNIGVLPSTPEINQHNISFYGSIPRFKVYGRQVGVSQEKLYQDVNSLDWFLTKTGYQGSIPEAQPLTVDLVENGGDFNLAYSWQLPDEGELKLYHRKFPQNEVKPLNSFNSPVKLDKVKVADKIRGGESIPVTYQWSGSWDNLVNGIVIVDWQSITNKNKKWIHDHDFAMGNLHAKNIPNHNPQQDFQVTENTAMFVPENMPEGDYLLQVSYLNPDTGETYPLDSLNVSVMLDKNGEEITEKRELDLISQLSQLSVKLGEGMEGLETVFAEVGRINQYDPTQDYLSVAEKAMKYRLENEDKDNLNYLYSLLLAQVLQQKVDSSIKTAQKLVEINPENPFNHGYLSFLHLYDWRGKKGEKAIQPALKLAPEVIEFKYLDGAGALMQGNFIKAWQTAKSLLNQ